MRGGRGCKKAAPRSGRGSQIQARGRLFLGLDGARATALLAVLGVFGRRDAAGMAAGFAVFRSFGAATGRFGGGSSGVFLGVSGIRDADGEDGTDYKGEECFVDFHRCNYLGRGLGSCGALIRLRVKLVGSRRVQPTRMLGRYDTGSEACGKRFVAGGGWSHIRVSVRRPRRWRPVSRVSSVRAQSMRRRARRAGSSTRTLSAVLNEL